MQPTTKISELNDGGPLQQTDSIVITRGVGNYKIAGNKLLTPEQANLLYAPLTQQVVWVRTLADLPTPTDTGDGNGLAYHLDNKNYIFVNTSILLISNPIVLGNDGCELNAYTRFALVYLGAGAFIRCNAQYTAGVTIRNLTFAGVVNTQKLFDIISLFFVLTNTTISDIAVGKTQCVFFAKFNSVAVLTQTLSMNGGLKIIGVAGFGGLDVEISAMPFKTGFGLNDTNKTYITLQGILNAVNIDKVAITPLSGEFGYNIEQNTTFNAINVSGGQVVPASGGNQFTSTSLTNKSLGISFQNVGGISNSTSTAEVLFQGNDLQTTFPAVNTPTPIVVNNANINIIARGGGFEERLAFQDLCTFNATTSTITTAFTHGMANNDIIYLFPAPLAIPAQSIAVGTLPTELLPNNKYFVRNVTATTFQLSEEFNGVPINFTTNGTGSLYFRHTTGNTLSRWIVNIGNAVKLHLHGYIATRGTLAGNVNISAVIMQSAGNLTISALGYGQGGDANIDNITFATSVISKNIQLQNGEGILIYVRNNTDTTAIIVERQILTAD